MNTAQNNYFCMIIVHEKAVHISNRNENIMRKEHKLTIFKTHNHL